MGRGMCVVCVWHPLQSVTLRYSPLRKQMGRGMCVVCVSIHTVYMYGDVYMYMHVYVQMYICMYACMYVCMYVCM